MSADKIPIHLVGDSRPMLYNISHIKTLRTEYNIVGTLSGTLPQVPQQNIFLGVPLQLMPEDAMLLTDCGAAVLVPSSELHKNLLTSVDNAENCERQSDVSSNNPNPQGIKIYHIDAESTKLPKYETILSLYTKCPSEDSERLYDTLRRQSTLKKYQLYKYLHESGYFLTSGLRFGCEFVAYPGDPLRYHSHFLADSFDYEEEIDVIDLVSGGRLATGVKKVLLLGANHEASDTEVCFSIEWSTFG